MIRSLFFIYAAIGVSGDVSLLYGALALAGVSTDMQNLARLVPAENTRTLNCFTANRLGNLLQSVETLTHLGVQQFRTQPMNLADDWDRLLYGLLETANLEFESQCRDIHVDPGLCEAVSTVGEAFIRAKVCEEIQDAGWRQRRCPSQPAPTQSPFSPSRLPFSFQPRQGRPRSSFENERPMPLGIRAAPDPQQSSKLGPPRGGESALAHESATPQLKEMDLFGDLM